MFQQTKGASFLLTIIALLGWFALTAQLYLLLHNTTVSGFETLTRYFSFFTILTNIIVAVCASVLVLKPRSGNFLTKPATLTAITVYITIVCVIYNIILRFLWQPQGLQRVVDELLHLVIPVLFIFFWLFFVPKKRLKFANVFSWLLYPVLYIIYTIIRGEISGYYPYPFIDVSKIGYTEALVNAGWIFVAFFGLSLLLVAIGKFTNKNQKRVI